MFTSWSPFESVWDVWFALAAASACLAWFSMILSKRIPRRPLSRFSRDERGAAYTLSIVMVLPTYVFLVCIVIECMLILQVKIGTMYAAYAAARSAAVWIPAETPEDPMERVQCAAAQGIAPFASARGLHVEAATGTGGESREDQEDCVEAYRKCADHGLADSYVSDKLRYARAATRVRILETAGTDPDVVDVEVEYEMPMNAPCTGRVFGGTATWPGAKFFTRKVVTTARARLERPKSKKQTLGIDYDVDH